MFSSPLHTMARIVLGLHQAAEKPLDSSAQLPGSWEQGRRLIRAQCCSSTWEMELYITQCPAFREHWGRLRFTPSLSEER